MISSKEIAQIIEAVSIINQEIYNQDPESQMVLTVITDGCTAANVEWLEVTIWSTEDDTRHADEDGDVIESYEDCFRREMKSWVQEFNKLKI